MQTNTHKQFQLKWAAWSSCWKKAISVPKTSHSEYAKKHLHKPQNFWNESQKWTLESQPWMLCLETTMPMMNGITSHCKANSWGYWARPTLAISSKLIAVYYVQTLVANLHSWVWKFPKVWGRAQVCSSRKTTKRPYPQLSQKTASCYWCWKGRCKLLIGDHPSI